VRNIVGQKYGRLTGLRILKRRARDGHILAAWRCLCGKRRVVPISRVVCGSTRSCGCLVIDTTRKIATKHGGRNTAEYRAWRGMKERCLNPNSKDYPNYGGRGITVCNEWRNNFAAFLAHVGKRPSSKLQLDRKDNRFGYVPGNVRWATVSQQLRNTRVSCIWYIKGGVFQTAREAADHFSVSAHTICRWVHGAFDKRDKRFYKPREDCRAVPRY